VLYREWFPQIVYNHHQTGPVGQVMWAPPFREPYNHRIHPLVRLGIETVASSMHTRFITERRPGVGAARRPATRCGGTAGSVRPHISTT
jgi:hypothetical protein